MTEKRYGIWNYVSCDVSSIVDKSNNNLLNIVDACELLNSLSEENEQLKNSVDILDKVRNELIDENEQLKQELKDLQIKFRKFNNHIIGGDVE